MAPVPVQPTLEQCITYDRSRSVQEHIILLVGIGIGVILYALVQDCLTQLKDHLLPQTYGYHPCPHARQDLERYYQDVKVSEGYYQDVKAEPATEPTAPRPTAPPANVSIDAATAAMTAALIL